MAGGAFDELTQTGELGPQTLNLLIRMGQQVTRTAGFPPPEGHRRWDKDAVTDLLTDMLSREGAGQRFVTTCFALATDEASLERLFLTSIKNYLKDLAKSTPRGKLRRRFASRLAADQRFRKVSGPTPRWALAEYASGPFWQGDNADLIATAERVRGVGTISQLNSSGPTPAKTVHALMTVLTAVLDHAGGPVREEDLAKVLEARFGLSAPAEFTGLYADDGVMIDVAVDVPGDTETDESEDRADEIWRDLSEHERTLLPYLDPGRDVDHAAKMLAIGPAQTAAVLDALRKKLYLALNDAAEQDAVTRALLRRSDGVGPPPNHASDVVST